jgi:hypothetical protein
MQLFGLSGGPFGGLCISENDNSEPTCEAVIFYQK